MSHADLLGYLASALVLATFWRDMTSLRVLAIMGNLAFMAYAGLAGLHPVLLHAALLPINLYHLARQARRNRPAPMTESAPITDRGGSP